MIIILAVIIGFVACAGFEVIESCRRGEAIEPWAVLSLGSMAIIACAWNMFAREEIEFIVLGILTIVAVIIWTRERLAEWQKANREGG